MKPIISFALAAVLTIPFVSCGKSSDAETTDEAPRSLAETANLLQTSIEDPALSFEEYQPIFEEVLDSLEEIVLHHPDADLRFFARRLPANILGAIGMSEPPRKRDSIWSLYEQRCRDILFTWYVQQQVDSTENAPFIIISYAAPYDIDGYDTRLSFTFSENHNPQSGPVLLMVLPADAYEDNPVVMFTGGKPAATYSNKDGNLTLFGSKEEGLALSLFDDFLKDMLSHDEIRVFYKNNEEHAVQVVVELDQFQKQYQLAHNWMNSLD